MQYLSAAAMVVAVMSRLSIAEAQDVPTLPQEPVAEPAAELGQRVELGYRMSVSYPKHIDRENVAAAAMGFMDFLHLGLQNIPDDPFLLRLLKFGVAGWVDYSVMFVSHEYGHLSSVSKTGWSDAVFFGLDEERNDAKPLTAWTLFMRGLRGSAGGMTSIKDESWDKIESLYAEEPDARRRFLAMMEAGGLNQEQFIAQRYGVRLRRGHLSTLDTVPYFLASLGTLSYPTSGEESDINDYVDYLEEQGLGTSGGRIKSLSALRFAGGSSIACAWGLVQGVAGDGRVFVDPIAWEISEDIRIGWPELGSYLSQVGPTVAIGLPIMTGSWEILPSYEGTVVAGGRRDQAGLGVSGSILSYLWMEASAYVQEGWWLGARVGVTPWPWLHLSVGWEGGRGYTFQRDLFGASNDTLDDREGSVVLGLEVTHTF